MQFAGILSRSSARCIAAASLLANHLLLSKSLRSSITPLLFSPSPLQSTISNGFRPKWGCDRAYHDGRPRGPLWRGKKLIGKEALFVILGMKRFKDENEKLDKFIKTHVLRLLKMDMVAVLTELERQGEVSLAVKMFKVIKKQVWYKPDVYLYKDLIVALARRKKMDDAMDLWQSMRQEDLFPDSQTYTEVIRGFLQYGSPADAMNIYEDMKKSPDLPEQLPFRILLKGLLPHPLLRNKVKQDFEEIFPDQRVYDPPEEIFGLR
ncbi:protein THYLAKOID ASSEMBLY 8-like, chloroplastic isoform X1 [Salvia miltiorrhiza]|uniref:protein THYLAKOID ASSEMBLY 8-like, chloroplastic isoform X1 n=1 Tax=Salvia miltiorrhiza TaxID=226208 RepID=UPI0025ACF030|nr:protein THYLAKOID ASSEMBLY 8-like, chloroplastic isoform X1 [Salvia miltiorrhiza]